MAKPDLSEFEALSKVGRHRPCSVRYAMEKLSPQEVEQVTAAMALSRTELETGVIRKWFEKRGLEVSVAGVTAHREGKCKCARDRILNG